MSTPRSSAAPRPSTLTVPATQGTAPVIKFRCLFTHDMRRKAKRWQDGFLRFHTFNKRVMVYDNGGYFIGDLHYRAPEGIQDGDELELDKGVLIQVCEPLEHTETDLSSLYKNKTTASPPNVHEPSSSVRAATPRPLPAQQAKTPAPQSYAQRQRPAITPAKRQRIASPERTSPLSAQAAVNRSNLPPQKRQMSIPVSRRNPTAKPPNNDNTAIIRPQLHTASARDDTSKQYGTTQHRPPQSDLPGQHQRNPAPQPQNNSTAVQNPPKTSRGIASEQLETTQHRPPQPVSRDPRPKLGPDTPTNPLRLLCGNPRRKLMYRESQTGPPSHEVPQVRVEDDPIVPFTEATSCHQNLIPDLNLDPFPESIASKHQVPHTSTTSGPSNVPSTAIPWLPSTRSVHPQRNPLTGRRNLVPSSNLGTSARSVQPPKHFPSSRSAVLRKSYSDPSTIDSLRTRPLTTASPLNPATDTVDMAEQGPWTSEALDLFDYWPPGRPKPT
ncbi:hypothetical protein BJX63DRAFT_443386 [Aspergillus granulosus]|uniref:5'-3' DNA helicase ZGRF1-like N-terminal domain-containing protein n=1 Tax=Aspergillus granulosus TaxID=176169 RepID=A0ABR4HAT2_9EURO